MRYFPVDGSEGVFGHPKACLNKRTNAADGKDVAATLEKIDFFTIHPHP